MLGLFKKFLSRSEDAAVLAPPPPPPLPKQEWRTLKPTPHPSASTLPKPAPARPAPIPRSPSGDTVFVPLATVAASLPESISHKVPANPDQFISIPVERVLPQISQGSVTLSIGELRACAPDFFAALVGHDDSVISLPLADIVKQLTPAQFARRPTQKRFEVPQEVTPVFAKNGNGVVISRPATTAAPAIETRPVVRPLATATTSNQPAAPAPEKIAMSPQSLAALAAAQMPPRPMGSKPTPAKPLVQTPAPAPVPVAPKLPAGTALKPVTPAPAPAAVANGKSEGELAVPLTAVWETWAEDVRRQLADVDAANTQVLIPISELGPALKVGKVLITWKETATWIRPALLIPPSPKVGEILVEFPLKVIAPLFMAHHRTGGAKKKVMVDDAIPAVFQSGKSGGAPKASEPAEPLPFDMPTFTPSIPAPVAQVAPTISAKPVSVPAPASAPAVSVQPAPANGVTLEQIVGAAGQRFSPKEVIQKTARIPGASGALLAMSDGLLVASDTPANVKAETVAAFLPQIFGRMNQYTKELSLGPLQELTLAVENGAWHIARRGDVFLAVLGKGRDAVPLNLVAQIAAELSSQTI